MFASLIYNEWEAVVQHSEMHLLRLNCWITWDEDPYYWLGKATSVTTPWFKQIKYLIRTQISTETHNYKHYKMFLKPKECQEGALSMRLPTLPALTKLKTMHDDKELAWVQRLVNRSAYSKQIQGPSPNLLQVWGRRRPTAPPRRAVTAPGVERKIREGNKKGRTCLGLTSATLKTLPLPVPWHRYRGEGKRDLQFSTSATFNTF